MNSFSPASGPAGTTVTISGSNFNAAAANNIVFFGAVRATVTSASTNSLSVTVPLGATYQPITVTTGGLTGYSSSPFIQTFAGGLPVTGNSFAPKIDSATDLHPNIIAAADYDGDGKPDLATANNYSTSGSPASVSVLRNTGTAGNISFAARLDLITGVLTYAIAAGDLNGDGKPDIVSSSIADKTISVFKNTSSPGNISFAAKVDYATGDNPFSIAIHDMDGDGKPDIVVVNYLSQTVSVYRNTGSSGSISFAPKVDFNPGLGPRCVAVGDLDGDGKPDLAVSNEFSNTVSIFRNTSATGNISFSSPVNFTTGSTPYSVAIGDLNNDGMADLAVSNNATTNFSIFKNTGSPGIISFAAKVDFACGAGQYLISIGDVNGDGKPDIILPSFNLSVSQNQSTVSTISFASPAFLFLSPNAFSASVVDMDGDGKDDIAGAIFTGNVVSLLRNRNNEPVILYFTPASAPAGATITITGVNFTGTTAVKFGGVAASSFTVVSSTSITAVVGSGASGAVEVTNTYGTGKMDGFTFEGPPVISSFSPATSGEGQTVTITGNNFSGATDVSFGGVAASSFTVVSPNTITAVLGTGASGDVSVTTPFGTGVKSGFTFVPFPVITSFAPTTGIVGTTVIITGKNFTGATAVRFGGTSAISYTVNSSTSISAVVGNGSSGNVSVTTSYGTATRSGFTFIPAPAPTGFTPPSGQTGTLITITGNNFTGITAVHFGGLPANSFSVVSANTITAVVGAGNSGSIRLTGPGGVDSINGFTFIQPVKISSITPDYGPALANILISGSGFQPVAANNKVTVGSVAASVISASPTSLTVQAPAVAVNKPVNVLVNHLTAMSALPYRTSFVCPDPTFSSASFANAVKADGGYFPESLSIADIDGDGKLDIITPDLVTKKIAILRNISSGAIISFATKVEFADFWISNDVVTADLDGDGKQDLISGNESFSNLFSVFRNTSTPGTINFDTRIDFPTPPCSMLLVDAKDVDGDGLIDIITRPNSTGSTNILVYRNISTVGNIAFDTPISFFAGAIGSAYEKITTEDLDGDNRPEIIFTAPYPGCIRNLSTPGQISFLAPVQLYNPPVNNYIFKGVADLNNDGKKDITLCNGASIYTLLNQSTTGNFSFIPSLVNTGSLNSGEIHLADMNGDGKPEILIERGLIAPSQAVFSVFRNTSTISTISFAPITEFFQVNGGGDHINSADIDGDNKMDIILCGVGNDTVSIYRNLMGNSSIQLCTNSNTSIISNLTGNAYQWQQNSGSGFVNINNNSNFSGTNTSTLVLTNIPPSFNGYQYRCQVDNVNFSSITSINVSAAPAVNAGRDTAICAGSSVQLNASGGSVYNWSPATGLNDPAIANPVATPPATTAYVVTASNGNGCFSKDTVLVTINPLISLTATITASDTSICQGNTVTFTAGLNNNNGNPVYQWQVNGVNTGTNSSQFTTAALQQGDQVRVKVTNTGLCLVNNPVTSNTINMSVYLVNLPVISLSNNVFTVTNPQSGITYTWQVLNNNLWNDVIPLSTGITFTVPGGGEYRVKAAKGSCSRYSASIVSYSRSLEAFVRPNPAHNILHLDSLNLDLKFETLTIYDMQGRQALPPVPVTGRTNVNVDISGLPAGCYFALLKDKEGFFSKVLFIKQ